MYCHLTPISNCANLINRIYSRTQQKGQTMKIRIGQTAIAFSSGMFMLSTKVGDVQIDVDIIAKEHRQEGTTLVKVIVGEQKIEVEV